MTSHPATWELYNIHPVFLDPYITGRWQLKHFFMFIPIWGRLLFWLIFFRWVETTNQVTSLETNVFLAPESLDGWKTILCFLLGCSIFRCELAVSFRECKSIHPKRWFVKVRLFLWIRSIRGWTSPMISPPFEVRNMFWMFLFSTTLWSKSKKGEVSTNIWQTSI